MEWAHALVCELADARRGCSMQHANATTAQFTRAWLSTIISPPIARPSFTLPSRNVRKLVIKVATLSCAMNKLSPFMQPFEQLPPTLPVFPLSNAVVLPASNLPLNIFEPRYLNMVQDAMGSHRLIGMIQPRDDTANPDLYQVGCAGRITRYAETNDGRLEIALTGLCRFTIQEELSTTRGYRLVSPDWSTFAGDYHEPVEVSDQDNTRFTSALRAYLSANNMEADWSVLEQLDTEALTNSFVAVLPLGVEDKQLLVETDGLANRLRAFTAILEGHAENSGMCH